MPSSRYLRWIAVFLLILLPLGGCSKIPKSSRAEREAVASLDEYEVSYEQLRYFVRNLMDDRAAGDADYWTEEKAEEAKEKILADAFDALRGEYAILSLSKKYGVDPDGSAIRELVSGKVESTVEGYGGEEAYAADLEAHHMTDSVFRFLTTVTVCREELFYAMLNAGDLENDEDTLRALVNGDSFIRVKQILVKNDEGESPDENRARAEELRARAAAGEDFDALVDSYGEDLFMFLNRDGYYICRGVWYKEFEDAAFALRPGEVSEVIETNAGYSILLRCEKEDAYLTAHFDELCEDYRDAQFSRVIEERAAAMTLTRRDALDRYTLLTMD